MKINLKSNLAGGIFAIIFSLALWNIIPHQVLLGSSNSVINEQFMPKFVAIVIFVSGVMLIVQSIIKGDKTIKLVKSEEIRALGYIGVLIGYTFLLTRIGFLLSSIFLSVMTLVLLKDKNWKHYAISIAIVVLLKFVFTYALNVPLP